MSSKTFVISVIIIFFTGCCSSNSSKQSQSSSHDGSTRNSSEKTVSPTTLKANASSVHAIIESNVALDSMMYRLSIQVTSVEALEGMETLAEVGQHLTVSPQYVLTDSGTVDRANTRNEKLLSLRTAKAGDSFTGKISLTDKGAWMLLEVLDR